jgi:hypothetical protein
VFLLKLAPLTINTTHINVVDRSIVRSSKKRQKSAVTQPLILAKPDPVPDLDLVIYLGSELAVAIVIIPS